MKLHYSKNNEDTLRKVDETGVMKDVDTKSNNISSEVVSRTSSIIDQKLCL